MDPSIGVAGLSGRMGRLLAEEVQAAGVALAGGISRSGAGPDGVCDVQCFAARLRARCGVLTLLVSTE